MRRTVANLLMTLLLVSGVVAPLTSLFAVPAYAQEDDETAATAGSIAGARDENQTAQLMSEYWEATQDCSVPSLECLVYHTVNFVGIELVVSSIFGGAEGNPFVGTVDTLNGTLDSGAIPPAGSSLPTDSTVASAAQYGIPAASGKYTRAQTGGAIGGLNNMMAAMYDTPVANTQTYVADAMNNVGIATPAHAQGLGFAALNPVLSLWKIFRNLAYTFYIILFIAVGFMIMLRTKLGNNTAVTVQQAIPQIITSLIFVTFSYAIGGFMIDMMYLVMALVIGLFQGVLNTALEGGASQLLGYNIFALLGALLSGGWNFESSQLFSDLFQSMSFDGVIADFTAGLGGMVVSVVIAIAIVIGWFRLFFELLKSYATVVLSIVTAPLVLMLGAIPGRSSFGPWLKDLIGNLLPFPTVVLVLVMFFVFTEGAIDASNGGFMPPFLLGSGAGATLANVLGLAIILALPDIVKKVKEPLVKEGFGSMVVGAGMKNAKEAFDKIPGSKALYPSNLAKQAALLPVRAAAGYGLGRFVQNQAIAHGYDEKTARRYGRIAGGAGFFGGPAIARQAISKAPAVAGQLGQAVIAQQLKNAMHQRDVDEDKQNTAVTQTVIEETLAADKQQRPNESGSHSKAGKMKDKPLR